LDRHTNGPGGSGGASPTVMTPRHNDDGLVTDNDDDTRPFDLMTPPPKPAAAKPAPAVQDAHANGGPAAGRAENSTLPEAETDAAAADAPPALPADGIGQALDGSPNSGAPAPDEPYPGSLTSDTFLHPGSATEPSAPGPSPTEPSAPGPSPTEPSGTAPSPGAVSAAAFAWETPGPAPVPPSSPARNFRSSGNAKTAAATGAAATATGAAAAAVGSASTPAGRAAEPARGEPKRSSRRQARQAHLTIARVEPWSVMKFSFVVSLVAFVILFVAVSVLYGSLSALGVFDSLQRVVTNVTSSQDSAGVNAAKWFTASKVLGYTALLGSLNIVLITAMATIGSVVYNLTSRLIGGVEVTLRETE
jgi:Transmembrane domain of unknown function (DUF3566)